MILDPEDAQIQSMWPRPRVVKNGEQPKTRLNQLNEKLLDRDVGNFKRLEIPYYFVKKSSIEGNTQAQEYLNSLSPQESWVPPEEWYNKLKGNDYGAVS